MLVVKVVLLVLLIFPALQVPAQSTIHLPGQATLREVASPASASINRGRGLSMLDQIKEAIKTAYFDKNFRGIDLDARFKAAAEKIKKLESNRDIYRVIAQVVLDFNDSHTTFLPPDRASRVEYGFSAQMVGNNCLVTDVKKGSDAEAKGLKVGDVIEAFGNTQPTRENLWKINYLIYRLAPAQMIELYVRDPVRPEKKIEITAVFKSLEERRKEDEKRRKEKREDPFKCQAIDQEAIACKLRTFSVDKSYIDKMMKEVSGYKKLVLDLRGNGGGYVKTEEHLTGYFFDRTVKIADFIMRTKTSERIAKLRKENVFKGDLVVLIDSNSASASEVFSRVIQLEKRGQVVGDVSAGKVMTSQFRTMVNRRGVPETKHFPFLVSV